MKTNESGFTIIELLIATAIFAVILVLASTTLIGITDTYIKGSVEGQTQQTARAILSDITEDFQANGDSYQSGSPYTLSSGASADWFCIGTDVYVYALNVYVSTSTASTTNNPWALVRYQGPCPSTGNTVLQDPQNSVPNVDTNPEELLAGNERVVNLYIPQGIIEDGQPAYTVMVTVAYANQFSNFILSGSGNGSNVFQCHSGLDSSFCAVSTLTTTVSPVVP